MTEFWSASELAQRRRSVPKCAILGGIESVFSINLDPH
ncbi:hypothetical protein GARC_0877 [Paraglaciecola arctica BSs20135]|uniref:Uncharacterized protein n=1 Tax=Paraglaciecola arctica BSs20135 TaxID=493475 RepID=K6YMK9_9ALTE|nr:hypothetical protein GARC_0877 [Paraglaciecola arctica BSs20135]